MPTVLACNAEDGHWLQFENPLAVLQTRRLDEVPAILETLERETGRGRWAAGFIAYEAAPAFDRALAVRPPHPLLPLLWFGLYEAPRRITREALSDGTPPGSPDWRPTVEEEAYVDSIGRVLEQIRRGNTYQVNYTLRLRGGLDGSCRSLFGALIDAQEPAYGMFLETEAWALCGASPELFLKWDGRDLLTKPMKGTRPRGLWPAEDQRLAAELAAAEKDRAEHVMIVDMARNDLGRLAETGTVTVDRPFAVEAYPTLWQMTSEVRCTTGAGLSEILNATFPAASITGAPKASTMGIIAELETTPRGVYTGSMGFIGPGRRAQLNVAIRTVTVDRTTGLAEYGTGGGIVWDSKAGQELEECRVKARILTRRLPPFSLLETLLWTPDGGLFLLKEHLDRLADSAGYFGFTISRDELEHRLGRAVADLPPIPHRVRLVVPRHAPADVTAAPLTPFPSPYRVALAKEPVDRKDLFLYHKTTRRDVYEEAKRGRDGVDDVILWNGRGEVTESTLANILVELDGRWVTPPVSSGLLGGVYRAELIRQGGLVERPVQVDELKGGARIRLCNSVRRCWDAVLA